MNVDFSFCLIFNKETQFLYNRTDFFMEHKLLPVQVTWLHLVYGKMVYLPQHPLLMVYVEWYSL